MATLPCLSAHEALRSAREGAALQAYFRARAQRRRAGNLAALVVCALLSVVLALLSGCASAQPRTLQRGAATAPQPAPLRPDVGAPLVGAPNALFSAATQRDERCRASGANTQAVHRLLNKYQVSAGEGGAQ